ncbi:MAG: hypothetical protein HUN05_13275 [Desulfobacter sp.]|nr:MAG: hypothetical protein HUN05_13275 [Desulfobacter sp.]
MIPGFIRSLANAFLINPSMSHCQANKRLKYLGWEEIEIDYHTFSLAINALETKGLKQLKYKSAPWYVSSFKDMSPISKPGPLSLPAKNKIPYSGNRRLIP